jgi:hypothetical protein
MKSLLRAFHPLALSFSGFRPSLTVPTFKLIPLPTPLSLQILLPARTTPLLTPLDWTSITMTFLSSLPRRTCCFRQTTPSNTVTHILQTITCSIPRVKRPLHSLKTSRAIYSMLNGAALEI